MLHEEVELYSRLTGKDGYKTPIGIIGAYLDGYEKGKAEQRTGKWNDCDPICPVCGEDKFKDLDADIWADWKPKFCPNCGAKMKGATDADTKI